MNQIMKYLSGFLFFLIISVMLKIKVIIQTKKQNPFQPFLLKYTLYLYNLCLKR